ncbi:MAG: PH domain-containing protein [Acidimicrobiales bacterium]
MQPLPPSVRYLWRALALAAGVVTLVGLGAVEVVARRRLDGVPGPILVAPVVAGVAVGTMGWGLATVRHRSWRFELTEAWFQARWGVVTHHCATVPRNRVQTLTTHNGPLDRILGLTSVTIHTAGAGAPNVSIPHLDDATVDWLRGELAHGPLG